MEEMIVMSAREQHKAEVVSLLIAGAIRQKEAAERLEISVRQVRRLKCLIINGGSRALISKRRGRPSNNRISDLLAAQILERIRERYPDFGPTLAHEKLVEEDGFMISLSSVRRLMIQGNVWHHQMRKQKRIHPRRERRPSLGELIQIDGSLHDWFEGRAPKCCLIVFIDDATSEVVALRFVKAETTFAYFETMEIYLKEYGRPQAVYSDKHGIFRINHGSEMETTLTEFGRAMKELEIVSICAHSPQAKGRVERVNSTLQDRLVKELRLRNISDIDSANAFLSEFREDYNRRFAVAPKNPIDAHRPLDRRHDLNHILSIQDTRVVSKTLSFQFESNHYQILEEGYRARQLIGMKVKIVQTMTNSIEVFHRGRKLTYTRSELVQNRPKSLDAKELNSEYKRWLNKKPPHRPSATHPFRRPLFQQRTY